MDNLLVLTGVVIPFRIRITEDGAYVAHINTTVVGTNLTDGMTSTYQGNHCGLDAEDGAIIEDGASDGGTDAVPDFLPRDGLVVAVQEDEIVELAILLLHGEEIATTAAGTRIIFVVYTRTIEVFNQ